MRKNTIPMDRIIFDHRIIMFLYNNWKYHNDLLFMTIEYDLIVEKMAYNEQKNNDIPYSS